MVLMISIYRANKAQNKKEYLEAFLDDFELLKLEVRLCADMKIITIKKQAEISLLMDVLENKLQAGAIASLNDARIAVVKVAVSEQVLV